MSFYFFEANDEPQRYLTERLPGETLNFSTEPLRTASQAHGIAADAEVISPFVHSHLGVDVLDELKNLKMIATCSTGFDHINLPCAESWSIPACNVPTYGENTVAEHIRADFSAVPQHSQGPSANDRRQLFSSKTGRL